MLMLTGDAEGKKEDRRQREREREVEMGKRPISLTVWSRDSHWIFDFLCDHLTPFFLFISFF